LAFFDCPPTCLSAGRERARARHSDTTDYRPGRQLDGQPVQDVEEQGGDEEQRE
jgi:hypothetical protein